MTYIATDPHFLFVYIPGPLFVEVQWFIILLLIISMLPSFQHQRLTSWHIFNETRLWDTSLSLLNANTFQCFIQAWKWLFCPLSIHISINVPAYISSLGSFFCQKVPFRIQFQSRLSCEALLPYLLSSLELPSPWFSLLHPPSPLASSSQDTIHTLANFSKPEKCSTVPGLQHVQAKEPVINDEWKSSPIHASECFCFKVKAYFIWRSWGRAERE